LLITGLLMGGLAACEQGPSIEEVRKLQTQERYQDSLEPLRELIDLHPDDPEINFRYGLALNRSTSSPVAVWALRKAGEDPDWAAPAQMELAAANLRNGAYLAAIESATQVLEIDPEHITALSLRGMAYLSEGKEPELALDDFDLILELQPENHAAMTSRAAILLVLGRIEDAEKAINEIDANVEVAEASRATLAMFCATRAVLQSEKLALKKAEYLFEGCLERFPDDGIVVEQSTAFFDGIGNSKRATKILRNALKSSPGSPGFRGALASRAILRGDRKEAEAILKDGTLLPDPLTQSAAWTALSNLYLEVDDLTGAIDAFAHAMALTPKPSQLSILTHADLLARAERHAEALEVAKKLERDEYRGLIEARVHLNELRPAEALARLEEVLPSWPNNPGARYYAARAAEQLGDFERAIEEYRQSIRSGPEQTDAGLRLANLYFEAGALQNAWNSAAQYFRANPTDPAGVRILLRTATAADDASVRHLFANLNGSPMWPTALAIRAEMLDAQAGPEAALSLIKDAKGIDLTLPSHAELLRIQIGLQIKLDRFEAARMSLDSALSAHENFGPFHEIQGFLLDATGGSTAARAAAYRRAVEFGPTDSLSLESLGHLEQATGNWETAVDLYKRAVAADSSRISPGRRIAQALEENGRGSDAKQAWEAHLREQPWDSEAAISLARLRLQDGQLDDKTLELAERAVLFKGGLQAQQLLIATHKSRGESVRASAVEEAIETNKLLPPMIITPIGDF
jgi:tetratricopeptide (TPR) repeat protein